MSLFFWKVKQKLHDLHMTKELRGKIKTESSMD